MSDFENGPHEHRQYGPNPMSWRDVYVLLNDSHREVMGEFHRLDERISSIEDARLLEQGRREGQAQVFGLGKAGIALVVSIVGGVLAVASFLR